MKNRKQISITKQRKRHRLEIKRRRKKNTIRRNNHNKYIKIRSEVSGDFTPENIIQKWLPPNVAFLISCKQSILHIDRLLYEKYDNDGIFKVPKIFSIIDYPQESYRFLRQITNALITQKYAKIKIDYGECTHADLGTHVLLDIILKDVIAFYKRCSRIKRIRSTVKSIDGINIHNEELKKFLFSVGSPAIHANRAVNFKDIVPYKLCIHDREKHGDPVKVIEQKDIDTTTMVDYVLDSLNRLNKTLSPDKLDDLCTVIGEILINAEEHSTTKYRFSIGYFHEKNENGQHFGEFRLTILNFGNTIYEKFKDPNCPNVETVKRMNELSKSYTTRSLFTWKVFNEETLWTLYALQEGVTSIPPDKYKKRGNGSIQFIESFFNLSAKDAYVNDVQLSNKSWLTIMSGNTKITFDGSYNIAERVVDGDHFKFMTFNKSGNIEDKPDDKYVRFVPDYFPGTMICAKIIFNEDVLTEENE